MPTKTLWNRTLFFMFVLVCIDSPAVHFVILNFLNKIANIRPYTYVTFLGEFNDFSGVSIIAL